MKLMLENLPPSLADQKDALRECLEAFDRVMPLQTVYLFGSHARGEARPDSDVDLCLVSEGAERQLRAAVKFRRATRSIRPKPAFTLLPIAPARLREKRKIGDHFFHTVLEEGITIGSQD
ncbi:MAG: nucleotidyltransferase domain-containing protein [Lentisphaeria bacterium]|nr:nucleotidyltransferase domain-containing protein [Lentisphaeria bacterium]